MGPAQRNGRYGAKNGGPRRHDWNKASLQPETSEYSPVARSPSPGQGVSLFEFVVSAATGPKSPFPCTGIPCRATGPAALLLSSAPRTGCRPRGSLVPSRRWRRCPSATTSWRKSSSASPPSPTSAAPARLAPRSAASSPPPPSFAACARFTPRPSSASTPWTEDSTRPRRPTPPPPPPAPSPQPADFNLLFLPSPDRWRHRDLRDGLTLVSAVPVPNEGFALVKNLAVCDILHRRYLLLPVVPEDMEGLVGQEGFVHYETFLDPAGDDEGDSSFRVFCLAMGKTKLVLFIFSSSSGRWDAVAFDGWKDLIDAGSSSQTRFRPGLTQRYYTHGCIYWVIRSRNKLLMLDTHLMKFSCIDVPPAPLFQQRAIVEAGEGRLGMFVLRFHSGNDTYDLCYTVLPDDGVNLHVEFCFMLLVLHSLMDVVLGPVRCWIDFVLNSASASYLLSDNLVEHMSTLTVLLGHNGRANNPDEFRRPSVLDSFGRPASVNVTNPGRGNAQQPNKVLITAHYLPEP
ncbi:hypothetical protein EJB05_11830, partial [Eragrostis curvula]